MTEIRLHFLCAHCGLSGNAQAQIRQLLAARPIPAIRALAPITAVAGLRVANAAVPTWRGQVADVSFTKLAAVAAITTDAEKVAGTVDAAGAISARSRRALVHLMCAHIASKPHLAAALKGGAAVPRCAARVMLARETAAGVHGYLAQ